MTANRFLCKGLFGCLCVLLFSCREVKKEDTTVASVGSLPDLNLLFEDYEKMERNERYDEIAREIVAANTDLKSSELYMEAASLYQLADKLDTTVLLIHKAIDHGMANPAILKQYPGLVDLKTKEMRHLKKRLDSLEVKLHNISNFALEMRSMDQFWPYFEEAKTSPDSAMQYLKNYILTGPPEIRDYYAIRYYNLENMYGQMINGSPKYYTYLRGYLRKQSVEGLKQQTELAMQTFKTLYPNAVFPKVYMVPGLLNSGGTASEMGLFIGGDMYGRSDGMPVMELNDWQKEAIMEMTMLPQLILHELMHFQQNYGDEENRDTVLYKIIEEGVCDFLVELSTGIPIRSTQLEYLDSPENFELISADLQQELFSEDVSNWLYNGGSIEDRPHDLGYALGYLISKSYYQNAVDQKKALEALLTTNDMRSILKASDYAYLLVVKPNS
ncbi:MAG: hypothetical protein HKP53_10600 [Eudoraea sp.]|nr:hypothetical protein [Eudoraea sp.]